jgi:tRNA (guanine-N7-)-methyltransferase
VRSYVLRQGRMSEAQHRAVDTLYPVYGLPYVAQPLDPAAVYGRHAPLVLEIGSGMGETTAAIAAAQPGTDFLAVEVHLPGVGALLKRIAEGKLANLRVVRHDAVEVLEHMIAPGSLAGMHIYFADPWPKKRHHKRRLVQTAFVALAASRLAPGGYLHLATDWPPYAEHMLEVLRAEPALDNASGSADGYAPRPAWRPLTKFEQRGLKLGHAVHDLLFLRAHGARCGRESSACRARRRRCRGSRRTASS